MPWTTYANNTLGYNTLTYMDLARNVLTGTLPPELANISTSLRLSVFDNNGKQCLDVAPAGGAY